MGSGFVIMTPTARLLTSATHTHTSARSAELQALEDEALSSFEKSLEKSASEGEEMDDSKQLRNQFNYNDSSIQTQNNATRDRETSTEPPPTSTYSEQVTQWTIYDAYMRDRERSMSTSAKKAEDAAAEKGGRAPADAAGAGAAGDGEPSEIIHSAPVAKAMTIIERMVNQNTFDDIAQDFKYWEDKSDTFRDSEGSLMPLWKFYSEKARRKDVTSLSWNPEYVDLFAVGYGSFNFMRPTSGLVCCYSLKNPSHPEYTFTTESAVMCLDFNPQHPNLLAVGLYDGSVLVYDIRLRSNKPIFASTVRNGKHTDVVWRVKWQEEDMSKAPTFFSVSSDGRVTLWTVNKTELTFEDVTELNYADTGEEDGDVDTVIGSLSSGCSFDFNRQTDHLFIVGTEEGNLHKCSKLYSSQYLQTYEGHTMSVYSVNWNAKHAKVFLTCSADWTVKIWDHNSPKPVMTFDLNNDVGDAAWSPLSSTVFAAATSDGKVFVYDLNENRHEPVCEQKVVRKAKLTKIAFNPRLPVLLVGDDRGCVTSLKLSPNLRKEAKDGKSDVDNLSRVLEIAMKNDC